MKNNDTKQLKRKILATSALPYANGPLHIGHGVEYIQTDIWVRFMNSRGHKATYICADDTHGAPIMLAAEAAGVEPQEWIDRISEEHQRDFDGFGINFDNYGSTHSDENQMFVNEIYSSVLDSGLIEEKKIEQLFDEQKGLALADRYVIGICPTCNASDQFGDNCEVCGDVYDAKDLINPRSKHSNSIPVLKESTHSYFRVSKLQEWLKNWVESPGRTDVGTKNKVLEWHVKGLKDWDISRDGPYWGFAIPDKPGKYFYVWFDAPIGYIASTYQWCKKTGSDFSKIWRKSNEEKEYEIYHFIGKDIVSFHMSSWPVLLDQSGFNTPDSIFVHGFLTVNSKKMSKREGTFITLAQYLEHLPPEFLRYYYASKLSATPEDIDLNLEDFVTRTNGDLVGKLVNIASRSAPFIERQFNGRLASELGDDARLLVEFAREGNRIAEYFEARQYSQAIRSIMALADRANQFIEGYQPWNMIKDPRKFEDVHRVVTLALNLFKTLMVYLDPVIPQLSERVWAFLNIKKPLWADAANPLLDQEIQPYKRLLDRIDIENVNNMVADSTIDSAEVGTSEDLTLHPLEKNTSLSTFKKLDIRVGRISRAERVDKNPKFTHLLIDIGEGIPRSVYANINGRYTSSQLAGKLTTILVNVPEKIFSFGTSTAMLITASGNGEHEVFLLEPDSGARPGMKLF